MSIASKSYRSPAKDQLRAYLSASLLQDQKSNSDVSMLNQKNTNANTNLETLLGKAKNGELPKGSGASLGDAGLTRPTPQTNPILDERLARQKREDLEKHIKDIDANYSKSADFHSLLNELESRTNKGEGGVLTNSKADLPGSGKIMSAVPSSVLGIASLVAPEQTGVSNEDVDVRKLVDRVRNEYMKSTSGMRVTDQAAKRDKEAMGMLSSGDPALMSKGIRSLAKAHQEHLRMSVAGKDPEALTQVHSALGYDPRSDIKIADDNSPSPSKKASPMSATAPLSDAEKAEHAKLKQELGL